MREYKLIRKLGIGFFLFVTIFAFDVKAARVEPQKDVAITDNFDIGPTSFGVEVDPGQTVRRTIQVTNRKGYEQGFKVEIEDFEGSSSDPSQTVSLYGKESGKYSAKEWADAELDEFTINHGERQFFDIEIKVPENADAGDHYLAVLVSAPPKKEVEEIEDKTAPAIRITSRAGTLFFIKVRGATKEEGVIEGFKSDRPWYEKGPVGFNAVFRNTGSVRLQPWGIVEIRDSFGKVIDTVKVNPFNVLRESVRQTTFNWDKKYLAGRYSATLILNRGYGGLIDEKTIYFWIVPWKQGLIALGGFILLLGLFIFFKRRINFKVEFKRKDDTQGPAAPGGYGPTPPGPPAPNGGQYMQNAFPSSVLDQPPTFPPVNSQYPVRPPLRQAGVPLKRVHYRQGQQQQPTNQLDPARPIKKV